MIEPILALTFAMEANPGAYAVLLGSGISRAAGVPTGWEVTLDLIGKLAEAKGEACEPSPEGWYTARFGKEPAYDDLLKTLAHTPTERQLLLRSYFEPSDEDRQHGRKAPTEAHRAIARLAADGFVRVIITTNFDQLMENALREAGVTPTVLSTPGHVDGALPIMHARCTVLKLHGDYMDHRLANTPEELARYPRQFNKLLDRIFDEFGLIVCGWSATWDAALRAAILRAKGRRFTTFWAAHGELSRDAQSLASLRSASVIQIQGADAFFADLRDKVGAIRAFGRQHPMSAQVAVATLKKYLSDPQYRIQHHDLVMDEVARLSATVAQPVFSVRAEATPEALTARTRAYDAATDVLTMMAAAGTQWLGPADEEVWLKAVGRLIPKSSEAGTVLYANLRAYPASRLMYALGIAAVHAGNIAFLTRLLRAKVKSEREHDVILMERLAPAHLVDEPHWMKNLEGMNNRKLPLNDWLFQSIRSAFRTTIPEDSEFEMAFDRFELLVALAGAIGPGGDGSGQVWASWGCFAFRYGRAKVLLDEVVEAVRKDGIASPYLPLLGKTVAELEALQVPFINSASRFGW